MFIDFVGEHSDMDGKAFVVVRELGLAWRKGEGGFISPLGGIDRYPFFSNCILIGPKQKLDSMIQLIICIGAETDQKSLFCLFANFSIEQ